MHPNGGGRPTDEGLMRQIERDFGSFDAFRAQFTEAANQLQGSGWVLLVWQPMAEKAGDFADRAAPLSRPVDGHSRPGA